MTPQADQAAIAALTQKVLAAWAYHDADTFADVFVEDGTMILPGSLSTGRDEIREQMTKEWAGRWEGTQVTGKPISIRALGPDVILLLSLGGVLFPGETEVTEANAIRASWLAVRRDGEWKLASYQNSPRYVAASESSAKAA
ncbi:SgcJ/EcaC family oxidoreductase [Actinophytocola sp. NPDC049390]|uniref:SgcJ/EcaC family oxidoreductase n=1 Tax=Actinophytocola sp. NPDC049390 TaxID=3363894 RepID=UPI00379610A5